MNKKIISTIFICILFSMNLLSIAAEDASSQLWDLTNAGVPHWAKNHVDALLSKGIIAGYPDGTFKPDNTVETDAFIKMVVCALGYSLDNGKDYWAMPFIDKAKEISSIGEYYDLREGKIWFRYDGNSFLKYDNYLLKETVNPEINRQVYELTKVLLDKSHYVATTYVDPFGTQPGAAHVAVARSEG
jgi:hypothetical protein